VTGAPGDGLRARSADERGTFTLWTVGLCVTLLFLGGITLDLWRAFDERRRVAGAVESAAIAASSGINEDTLRATGRAVIVPQLASARAAAVLDTRGDVLATRLAVAPDGSSVTITGAGEVPFTLLRVLLADTAPLRFEVAATSAPRRGG